MPSKLKKETKLKAAELTEHEDKTLNTEQARNRGRHRLTSKFVNSLARDFDRHGAKTIEKVRERNPVAYCNMVLHLIPKETKVSGSINITNIIQDIEQRRLVDVDTPDDNLVIEHPQDTDSKD